ncbi:hypothetical protein CTAYLR_004937 [Chrysophaeum taylorii]|uniref:STAS domain-containing protein n=1 Tax=Chrysophaeum taylorii TaxID=2483200 RepID=A0AAD7UQA4_9STRA|nr:hypothetical protein CTAYLR_004937 [Chrysophaeum taylorii]
MKEAQQELPKLPTYGAVVENGQSAATTTKQLVVDISAGVIAFFVVGVVSVSFSFATFGMTVPSLLGGGSRMALVGVVVVGAVEYAFSKAPFMIVAPDLFVCPMLNDMLLSLPKYAADSGKDLGSTYVATMLIAVGCAGLGLVAAGNSAFLRIGEFVPYPIVCGLLGAVGVVLLRQSYAIATVVVMLDDDAGCPLFSGSPRAIAAAAYAPALVFGGASIVLSSKVGGNPVRSSLPLMLLFGAIFYAALAAWYSPSWHDTLQTARACGFLFDPAVLDDDGPGVVVEWLKLDGVAWRDVASLPLVGRYAALCLLVVFKSSLVYPTWERAFRKRCAQPLDTRKELVVVGAANVAAAAVGSFGAQPQLSTAVSLREMGASSDTGNSALAVVIICALAALFGGASPLAIVPKFAFAGLLIHQGWILAYTFVVKPCFVPPRALSAAESFVVVAILVVFVVNGMLAGLSVGAQLTVILFTVKSHGFGVFKYHGSAALQRSTTQRSPFACHALDDDGHLVQILRLHGLLYWFNANQLVRSIRVLVSDGVDTLGRPPKCIIVDFTLVLDVDASAADALVYAAELCHGRQCALLLSGCRAVKNRVARAGLDLRPLPVTDKVLLCDLQPRAAWVAEHLDDALSACEDAILQAIEAYRSPSRDPPPRPFDDYDNKVVANTTPKTGFRQVLSTLARRCGADFVDVDTLARLEPLTRVVRYERDDHIFRPGLPFRGSTLDEEDGIAFVELGVVAVRREPDQAPSTCLGDALESSPVFRMVRLGPGGVVGLPELFSGRRSIGATRAETRCKVHLLKFRTIRDLRNSDPALALNLYVTLAHILALAYDERSEKFARTLDTVSSHPRSELIPAPARFRAERAVIGHRRHSSSPKKTTAFQRTLASMESGDDADGDSATH